MKSNLCSIEPDIKEVIKPFIFLYLSIEKSLTKVLMTKKDKRVDNTSPLIKANLLLTCYNKTCGNIAIM